MLVSHQSPDRAQVEVHLCEYRIVPGVKFERRRETNRSSSTGHGRHRDIPFYTCPGERSA